MLCDALKIHFSSDGALTSTSRSSKVQQKSLVYSTIEKEDVRVFSWIRELIGRDVQSYSQ